MATIAVVGAGLAGLTAALRLVEAGHQVRVLERYPSPGGLARTFELGGEPVEAYYHHIFTSDTALLSLAEELGLAGAFEWLPSRMGFWTEGRLWDFGTPQSLLRFTPLSLLSRLRFGLSTLLLQHARSPAPFEQVTAARWLRKHQGEAVWRTIWRPLLEQKFAEHADTVAMVWLWSKFRVRGRSRSATGAGERLGYMQGSFERLVQALAGRFEQQGGQLHLSTAVRRLTAAESGGFDLECGKKSFSADRVVMATPIPDYLQISGHLLPDGERSRLARLEATGAVCLVLELKRQLTPYYWLNIADDRMPFCGVIEHTNFVPPERYGGRHLLYISKYMAPDSPVYRLGKQQVLERYLPALARLNPAFDPSWVLGSHLFRAAYAQPVVGVGYRQLLPGLRSPVSGLYLCSMGQVFPEDRGMNYAIVYGERTARALLADLDNEGLAQEQASTAVVADS